MTFSREALQTLLQEVGFASDGCVMVLKRTLMNQELPAIYPRNNIILLNRTRERERQSVGRWRFVFLIFGKRGWLKRQRETAQMLE